MPKLFESLNSAKPVMQTYNQSSDPLDWLVAEILADPRDTFIVWSIDRGFCETVGDFSREYGEESLLTEDIGALIAKGVIGNINGRLTLFEIGQAVVAEIGKFQSSKPKEAEQNWATDQAWAAQERARASRHQFGAGRPAISAVELLDFAFELRSGQHSELLRESIAADPSLADQLERLHEAISRLVDDGDVIEPPLGLATRTVAFVESRRRRPIFANQSLTLVRVPIRLIDLVVAACVFLAGISVLSVASYRQSLRQGISVYYAKLDMVRVKSERLSSSVRLIPAGRERTEIAHEIERIDRRLKELLRKKQRRPTIEDLNALDQLAASIEQTQSRIDALLRQGQTRPPTISAARLFDLATAR
ncbi:MAG: hypothetical protein P4L84_00820, partial [Isosphaeraceae bacterium]|nr:hypothetical protein [Isosphaeraceae bacterium]